jgi:hypothetical protein
MTIGKANIILKTFKTMTKLELLEDTLNFYGEDPSRRAVNNSQGYCEYLTKDGRQCAVGRLLDKDLIEEHPEWDGMAVDSIFMDLPENVQTYGKTFLQYLQQLHDWSNQWENPEKMEQAVMSCLDQIPSEELPNTVELFIGPFVEENW